MPSKLEIEVVKQLRQKLTARTLTSCSRWASHRRVMGSPFPGPYSWAHHPWVKELHDSWSPFTYVQKGAQLGVTEAAINRAFYTIDFLKRDVLYVLPTSLAASDFSKSRFSAALANSDYLRSIFTDTNTVNLKRAGANSLYIRGSRGRTNLKSIPVSELILDEVDEMDQAQIWLALERLSGQVHKHVWAISTPTIPNYGIHKLFQDSSQEHFFFRCPHCNRLTELLWPDCVEIIGEHVNDPRCKESFLKCKECKAKLEQEEKPRFLAEGRWMPTVASNKEVRGFYVNQLYSYTITAGELVVGHLRSFGDEFAAKEFHNSKLGLPYIGSGAKVTDAMLDAALRQYSMDDPRPQHAGRIITMGVDQGKLNHIVIVEWFFPNGIGEDISASAIGKVLWVGTCPEDKWEDLDQLMTEWQVQYAVTDADPQINEARRFARRFLGYASLCRYRRGQSAKEATVSEEDTGAPMLTVDRSNWLTATLSRFKSDPPRIELPRDIPTRFREHIKSLVRTYQRDDTGNPVAAFVNTGPDHDAHALTYAEIALQYAPLAVAHNIGNVL
jgi:hypothetical protein